MSRLFEGFGARTNPHRERQEDATHKLDFADYRHATAHHLSRGSETGLPHSTVDGFDCIVSRRGLWPREHAPHLVPHDTIWEREGFASLRALLKAVRREVRRVEARRRRLADPGRTGEVSPYRPEAGRLMM
jgi:hypothetical protein